VNSRVVLSTFIAMSLGLSVSASPLAAQSAEELVEQAVGAYGDLALDDAAWLLRRALNMTANDELGDSEQSRALMFLGATEVLRNNADSAGAAFRRLIFVDPRYEPDELIFPPDVTMIFETVRQQTKTVNVEVPSQTFLRLGQDRFSAWTYASSPHEMRAEITYDDGRLARTLYAGPVGDSLRLQWDGRDGNGRTVESGRFLLNVVSRDAAGGMIRLTRIPLDVDVRMRDTIPHPEPPADSLLLPERWDDKPSREALIGGLSVGAAVLILPAAVAPQAELTGGRLAVAGAVSIAGIVGFVTRRPGKPIRENVVANDALRQAWRDSSEVVAQQNAGLRSDIRVRIRAGRAVRIEGVGQ
jgi:hypothetical protein